MSCTRCEDKGNYYDDRCRRDVCDHQKLEVLESKWVTTTDSEGNPKEKLMPTIFGDKIMECPLRICLCAAGKKYKLATAEKSAKV